MLTSPGITQKTEKVKQIQVTTVEGESWGEERGTQSKCLRGEGVAVLSWVGQNAKPEHCRSSRAKVGRQMCGSIPQSIT